MNVHDNTSLLDRLAEVLDREIEVLDLRCRQLDRLSPAIALRDEATLDTLLSQIEQTQQAHERIDADLREVRAELADALGLAEGELKLSSLLERLTGSRRSELAERRRKVIALSQDLQQKNFHSAVVLFECARLNRLLLSALFPADRTVRTYGQRGEDTWRCRAGSLDMEG